MWHYRINLEEINAALYENLICWNISTKRMWNWSLYQKFIRFDDCRIVLRMAHSGFSDCHGR